MAYRNATPGPSRLPNFTRIGGTSKAVRTDTHDAGDIFSMNRAMTNITTPTIFGERLSTRVEAGGTTVNPRYNASGNTHSRRDTPHPNPFATTDRTHAYPLAPTARLVEIPEIEMEDETE